MKESGKESQKAKVAKNSNKQPKGVRLGGRQKGTPNKTTMAVKEALTEAFDKLGGVESLKIWASDNPTEFYKLWAKMLPQDMNHTGQVTVTHEQWLQALK